MLMVLDYGDIRQQYESWPILDIQKIKNILAR